MEKLFGVLSSKTIDISLRRSAAEQLSIMLQGKVFIKDYFELSFCVFLSFSIIYLGCISVSQFLISPYRLKWSSEHLF